MSSRDHEAGLLNLCVVLLLTLKIETKSNVPNMVNDYSWILLLLEDWRSLEG